ncbi:MAG: arginine--tRNA ligase [bacterium]
MIKELILNQIEEAIKKAYDEDKMGQLQDTDILNILIVEKTKNPEFGDYAVNISPLSRHARMAPAQIAEAIKPYINIDDVEVSIIQGFINFKLGKSVLNDGIAQIILKNKDFGRNNLGNSEKVLLEYVSANPTGPLHIGHGRWAAVGSTLANLLKFSGYDVSQEFYINDAGNQINNLGKSLWLRVLQELGIEASFPQTEEEGSKNYYSGEFLIEPAKEYLKTNKVKAEELYKNNPDPLNPSEEIIKELSDFAKALMLQSQKELLAKFRTNFDIYYSETSLHQRGEVEKTIEKLKSFDKLYEKEGALWFKSSEYGDDQDRVIKKGDGSYTYLTADIAYHYDKIERGFERLINIWGADHHGYVARIKASIEAMGKNPDCLEVLLGQLVNLIISGEQVRMGKRRKMLTLEDLIDEVGVDGTRFWMIMRSIDTTLDFDVDLAKSCSDENPVFYVQYAHARVCSILRTATAEKFDQDNKTQLPSFITKEELKEIINPEKFNKNLLESLWKTNSEKEIEATKSLILKLESFEDLVQTSAKIRAPYMIARYTLELAKDFHYFYTFTRVLNVENDLMKARLCLINAVKQVFANALDLLGVLAPESM